MKKDKKMKQKSEIDHTIQDIRTAYDIVLRFLTERGAPQQSVLDKIVFDTLLSGDVDAFVYFEKQNYVPGRAVLRLLSLMMSETAKEPGAGLIRDNAKQVPFQLFCKRRDGKAGRPRTMAIEWRDQLIAINVHEHIKKAQVKYEAAIEEVANRIGDGKKGRDGRSKMYETVRKAYDRYAKNLRE